MAAIGVLGGMGPQASAHLLNLLVREAPNHLDIDSDSDFPEIILLSVPVPNFIADKHNLNKTKQILIDRTKKLEQAGCTINGIACNTAHLLLPELQAVTKVPFVSIPQLVAQKLAQLKARRVGLLATPITLQSRLYDEALDRLELVRPAPAIAEKIEELILKQLRDQIIDTDRTELRDLVARFLTDQRLDAVILGCTELPLIFGKTNDERIIDTLAVLASGLLEKFATTVN